MEHVKATQRPLLDQIGKDGHLSEASDKALQKVVTETFRYLEINTQISMLEKSF